MNKEEIVKDVIAKLDDISKFLGEDSYSRIKMHFLSENVMTPVDETDHVVWDLETNGFNAPENKILEIGCFEVMKSGEIKKHQWVINNNCEISEEITKINGFTKEICEKEGVEPQKALTEFLEIVKRAKKNITHNGIRFDIPFLTNYTAWIFQYDDERKQKMLKHLRETAFDTAVHYKAKKSGVERGMFETFLEYADRTMNIRMVGVKYNLGLICQEEGVDTSGVTLHRALGDVHCTYEIYKKIGNK